MVIIRPITEPDWDGVWAIIEPVFRAGETYAYSPDITKEDAFGVWVSAPKATYVATDENATVLGTYYIKPNQPALGAHVCNCGYIVAEQARGQGIASEMCKHSQLEALALGYCAMQFNLVVSTNAGAIRLWDSLGFTTIGTLPGAFDHKALGYVDALVMYKTLTS
jgi:L-amino acid N-acyltransferase YncA